MPTPFEKSQISVVATEASQKSTSLKAWEALPWSALVGLVLALIGATMMLSALSLFYAHPMWEHGDNIIATFGSYKKFIGLVILFDVPAQSPC